jgi:hypothetical protein
MHPITKMIPARFAVFVHVNSMDPEMCFYGIPTGFL